MLEIVEVLRRSEQGRTEPFICRGSDDAIYYAKGRDAGKRSLICEWICGRLGRAIGLPIAPFDIAYVSKALVDSSAAMELKDLGHGPVFASREKPGSEITVRTASKVSPTVRRSVLLFDWWIKNGDRNLSEIDGNPNLLWQSEPQELVVIDHNVALDDDLSFSKFIGTHIVRGEYGAVFGDMVARAEYTQKLADAMAEWDAILAELPDEWRFLDSDQLDPLPFDWQGSHDLLTAFETEAFWTAR